MPCREIRRKVAGYEYRPTDEARAKSKLTLKTWLGANVDKVKWYHKNARTRHRFNAISHYSHGTFSCACCGEDHYHFLTIDHVNGGGHAHQRQLKRDGTTFYSWLSRNGYPSGFRVLCFNCNCAKGIHGVCPHESSLLALVEA